MALPVPPRLSATAEFDLNTGRLLTALSPLLVGLARFTDPHAAELPVASDVIMGFIIFHGVLSLSLSFFSPFVIRNFYYFVLIGFCMHGADSFFNLHLFHFGNDVQTGLLVYTFITVWFLRSRRDLLVYQIVLVSVLVATYLVTPDRDESAGGFLIKYLAIQILLFILVGSRISTIQRLIRKDLRYKNLFEGLNEGIFQLDNTGYIRVVNERLCQLTGYTQAELLNAFHVRQMVPVADHPMLDAHLSNRREGKTERYEMRLMRKDGSLIWAQVSASPTLDETGLQIGSTSILVDINDRKKAELDRDSYSHELKYLHQELSAKNEELDQFAVMASRDLKSPLEHISRTISMLKGEYPETEKLLENYFSDIDRSARRMRDMLDALLLYSLSGAKQMNKQRVEVAEVISEVKSGFSGHIRENRLRILYEELPVVQADHVQLLRLFRNLIETAVRYRGAEDPVVHISASENLEKREYIFAVEDNGGGIAPEDFDKLFLIFQKNGAEESESVSLGLSLCKKIVNNHGGRLWLTSNAGRGTIFFFSLPMTDAEGEQEELVTETSTREESI